MRQHSSTKSIKKHAQIRLNSFHFQIRRKNAIPVKASLRNTGAAKKNRYHTCVLSISADSVQKQVLEYVFEPKSIRQQFPAHAREN